MNNAATDIDVQISFCSDIVSCGHTPRSGIAGSCGSSTSIVSAPVYALTSSEERFLFPTFTSAFVICLFDLSHSGMDEMKPRGGLDLYFSDR